MEVGDEGRVETQRGGGRVERGGRGGEGRRTEERVE